MLITQASEAQLQRMQICSRRYDEIDIDDRFGSQPRDGGTANVLDRDSYVAHPRPYVVSKLLEYLRPIRIIVDHLNAHEICRLGHF